MFCDLADATRLAQQLDEVVPLEGRYAAPTLTSQQQKQQTLDALVAWIGCPHPYRHREAEKPRFTDQQATGG
jgi:hypothetical protein